MHGGEVLGLVFVGAALLSLILWIATNVDELVVTLIVFTIAAIATFAVADVRKQDKAADIGIRKSMSEYNITLAEQEFTSGVTSVQYFKPGDPRLCTGKLRKYKNNYYIIEDTPRCTPALR